MINNTTGGGIDFANWSRLAHIGSENAMTGLSRMVNQDITITNLDLEEVSMRNAVSLLGKADDLMVGIYLLFSGSASGRIMLAFKPETAFELIDMALELPVGSTHELGELERSVLGETGNIVGSFFLNAVADHSNLCLMPSPPAVVMDMCGALITSVMAESFDENESVFVIRLSFRTKERQLDGRFLVLPNFASPAAVPEHGEA